MQKIFLTYAIKTLTTFNFALALGLTTVSIAQSQTLQVPRRQDKPPGPPISAEQAVKQFTVPPGFHIEIVAQEPDLINPVAMAIDEAGRFWVTESIEYPRLDAGVGRDKVKVLEDRDGDGRVDHTTIFADDLNIPSGIAIGQGGAWVVNSPDLLFLEDTDGDGKADKRSVMLTGFGRTDTHELPSALTWGPDGWLYGLNGVFNYSSITYGPDNPNFTDTQQAIDFTCALWRIDPRSKKFEVFAQGTSNPWGIAINQRGDFILSACVIDHLWHIAQDAYYIRQGGPYPANTWPLRSIVNHHHQKAAYCGITYYDSDAYPTEYRDTLYMGNIHGGCLNSDAIKPAGSSYFGTPKPDLITANDAWFMPVAQITGPDGNLYILDWYDQYHCYQDANADPAGVERAKGRLYRLVYDGNDATARHTHSAAKDLGKLNDAELIALMKSENGFERSTAQRVLAQRSAATSIDPLVAMVQDSQLEMRSRLHALWTIGSMSNERTTPAILKLSDRFADKAAVGHDDPLRWCIHLLGNVAHNDPTAANWLIKFAKNQGALNRDPAVSLALISALAKCTSSEDNAAANVVSLIAHIATVYPEDETIQHVAYNCVREMRNDSDSVDALIQAYAAADTLGKFSPQWSSGLLNWASDSQTINATQTARLANAFLTHKSDAAALQASTLQWAQKIGLRTDPRSTAINQELQRQCREVVVALADKASELRDAATLVLATWKDDSAEQRLSELLLNENSKIAYRADALKTLIAIKSDQMPRLLKLLLTDKAISIEDRGRLIDVLSASQDSAVAIVLLTNYAELEPQLQSRTIETLTQRPQFATLLLDQVANQAIAADRFNLNQLQRVSAFNDEALKKKFATLFGSVRTTSSNDRQQVVHRMQDMLAAMRGDPFAGRVVFTRVCSQCHLLYGTGAAVGPDITRNGRNDWRQLIQNVFDPSSVIGPGYQAVTVLTEDDRIVTGIPTEQTDRGITLKVQGGKSEFLSADTIAQIKRGDVSLMPEQIELQMTPQETADLFAYLALDKPPEDQTGQLLSGSPPHQERKQDAVDLISSP